MRICLLFIIFVAVGWSQEKSVVISDKARGDYWRAVAMKQSAEAATKEANAALEKAVAALCPATHQPIAGQDGEPTCQVKAAEKKPESR